MEFVAVVIKGRRCFSVTVYLDGRRQFGGKGVLTNLEYGRPVSILMTAMKVLVFIKLLF